MEPKVTEILKRTIMKRLLTVLAILIFASSFAGAQIVTERCWHLDKVQFLEHRQDFWRSHKLFTTAPNPSPGSILSLLFEKPVSGEVSLFVFDLTGRQVFAQNIGKIQAGHRIETATNLPEGHYTVVVRIQGKLPEVLRWIVL